MESNLQGRGAQTIGPVTLVEAAEKEARFQHPDEIQWIRIKDQAAKAK